MKDEILRCSKAAWVGREIEFYDLTDSTNLRIHEFAQQGRANGLLAIAEEQTGGRGRRGRSWDSPPGTGIWMSLLLRPQIEPAKASMITVLAALAIARAVDKLPGTDPKIKWPNDVVLNGRKITGILTEMNADLDRIHYVVVGIGINANTTEFGDDIKATATSIYLETGEKVDRAKLVAEFCEQFERIYEAFLADGNLSGIKAEYESYLINIGKEVKIIKNRQEMIRKAIGINEQGELIVEDQNGIRETVFSGEVSVRGLYGYV